MRSLVFVVVQQNPYFVSFEKLFRRLDFLIGGDHEKISLISIYLNTGAIGFS
jgi:hypothetical protein